MKAWARKQKGFTIVELLIVIVVIAILAAIAVVAYSNIQNRAKNAQVQSDIASVYKLIEMYNAQTGSYPSTGSLSTVYVDDNCTLTTVNRRSDWVPSLSSLASSLPQNPGLVGAGRTGIGGCYMYASDGSLYVLSAWNAKRGSPSSDTMYRRLGFRDSGWFSSNNYLCNHVNIGGMLSSTYNELQDYYKYSYTVSNITNCNETPPPGA